ncbi:MAG: FAD:protein FMN transferase [Bacillota bacterium]
MKKTFVLFTLLLLTSVLSACGSNDTTDPESSDLDSASNTYTVFDSSVSVKIYVPKDTDSEKLEEIFDGVDTRLENIHELATRHESFEGVTNIHTINENPNEWHEVDPILFDLLELGIEYHDLTDGYFNITMGPVLDLWNQSIEDCNEDDDCYLPGEDELEYAGESVDIDGISMNEDTDEVSIEDGMVLDLGGIAKGFAAERISEYLKGFDEIDSFLINAGTSSIEIHGDHPTRENDLWQVSITDPENPGRQGGLGAVQVPGDTSVSTSGDYVRYFMKDDERYHHIIDPNTLYPADHYRSVSLIVKSGGMSDILSSAAFLMPPEESRDFIDEMDDVEALWVMPDGSHEMTDGFDEHVYEWRDD